MALTGGFDALKSSLQPALQGPQAQKVSFTDAYEDARRNGEEYANRIMNFKPTGNWRADQATLNDLRSNLRHWQGVLDRYEGEMVGESTFGEDVGSAQREAQGFQKRAQPGTVPLKPKVPDSASRLRRLRGEGETEE